MALICSISLVLDSGFANRVHKREQTKQTKQAKKAISVKRYGF